jgi:hypothetical protein
MQEHSPAGIRGAQRDDGPLLRWRPSVCDDAPNFAGIRSGIQNVFRA